MQKGVTHRERLLLRVFKRVIFSYRINSSNVMLT